MNKRNILLICILLLLIADVTYGQGCSQCKLVAEQGSELEEEAFGKNINYGILYLMAVPYLLIMFLFRHKILTLLKRVIKKQ